MAPLFFLFVRPVMAGDTRLAALIRRPPDQPGVNQRTNLRLC